MEKNLLQRLLDLSEDEIITFMGDQPLNSPEHKTAEQALEIFHRRKEKQKSPFMKFLMNPWTIGIGATVIASIIVWLIPQQIHQLQKMYRIYQQEETSITQ